MKAQHCICTVIRVKNEAAYIGQAITSVLPIGGPIIVLDDGSNDATPDIVRGFDAVAYLRQDDVPMDEGRDRTLLYREAQKTEAAWYFTLDGDEVLADPTAAHMLRAVEHCPDDVNVFKMWLAVMASEIDAAKPKWYGPTQPEGAWTMDRMIRLRDADPEHEFTSGNEYNLHCGVTPKMRELKKQTLNAWIKYYGYETPERVARKAAFYEQYGKNNTNKRAMWRRRLKMSKAGWQETVSANELGIAGTVTY